MKHTNLYNKITKYLLITIALVITTIAVYFFMIPANIIIGSVTGISMILNELLGFNIALTSLCINTILVFISYVFVGKDFAIKTIYASLLVPLLLFVFEILFPNPSAILNDRWLDLVAFILIFSGAQTILFNANSSSGGLDVIAKITNKYIGMPIGLAVSIVGCIVSLSAIFVYDIDIVILSVIGTYLNGVAINHFTDSFNQKKRVCILSSKYSEISDFIMNDLKRGVSLYPVIGGYTKKEGYEIQIAIESSELMELLNHVKSVDENAFISISSVHSIHGNWNSRHEIKKLRKQNKKV